MVVVVDVSACHIESFMEDAPRHLCFIVGPWLRTTVFGRVYDRPNTIRDKQMQTHYPQTLQGLQNDPVRGYRSGVPEGSK